MIDESRMTQPRVTLKTIAEHVGLTPGTISAVLNNTRAADRIPQSTRDRVIATARRLNYSPNPLARALRAGKATMQPTHRTATSAMRGALFIVDGDQLERALHAVEQAGLRVPEDVSVVDLFDVPGAWEHPRFGPAPEHLGYDAAKVS
jgi:DNA-binding LacI/PurR family transcriptional regulator